MPQPSHRAEPRSWSVMLNAEMDMVIQHRLANLSKLTVVSGEVTVRSWLPESKKPKNTP
jgi:hypothetical protein